MELSYVLTWGVLLTVLAVVASGRFRMELAALAGLLVLGIAGVVPPAVLFSGFGHPALATVVAVILISQAIVETGMLRGLGQALAGRVSGLRGQVVATAATGAALSAFMNNVGAVGLMLPTVVRMSGRAGCSPGTFGLPLVMASILGGTITLIGSAPNIIIASYLAGVTGQPFRMLDFAPHGLAMLAVALVLWSICKSCGLDPGQGCEVETGSQKETIPGPPPRFAPLATKERRVTFFALLIAIALVSAGILHPALAFGGAALVMFLSGSLRPPEAYRSIDLKIVLFLGAMLGIGETLEQSGALEPLAGYLSAFSAGRHPLLLIAILLFSASALSNAINNAASAVFMAPLAVGMAAGGELETTAALMAVAAGSNLTLLVPTHQAALLVMSKAPFPPSSFLRFGLVITFCCGLAAVLAIGLFWQ